MNVLGLAVQTGNVSNLDPRALCSSFEEEGLGHPNLGRPYSETFPRPVVFFSWTDMTPALVTHDMAVHFRE